jgi:hypothetical protein
MKFLGILLLVCPLMAQIGSTGPVASVAANVSSTTATALLPAAPFSGGGAAKMDGEIKGRQFYRWSIIAIMAGNAADTVSSWHHPEANPVLANPGAGFGVRSVALKAGLLGTSLLLEHWALKHNPGLYRRLAWMNVAIAGGLGEVAARNASLP